VDLCEALIAAQVQLAWGSDPRDVARAMDNLRACAPDSAMLQPLAAKVRQLSAS
jgi:hypothetical protein